MLFFFSLFVYPVLLVVLMVALLLLVQIVAYGFRVRARRQGRPEPKVSLWAWRFVAVLLSFPLAWLVLLGGLEGMIKQSTLQMFCQQQRLALQERLPDEGAEKRVTRGLSARTLEDPSLTYLDLSCPSTWKWSKEGIEDLKREVYQGSQDGKPGLPRPPKPPGWKESSAEFFTISPATTKKYEVGPNGYGLWIYCREHIGRPELVREVFPEGSFLGKP